MNPQCHIELFGGVRIHQGERLISRFYSQRTAVLLAYLAYYRQRTHPRELLIELLWPGCELHAGRNSLSVALSSIRRQLEPPGVPAGGVLQADRATVGLNPDLVTTDVSEFEAALDAATSPGSTVERVQRLTRAVQLYRGELLAGYYEDWILPEQGRLAERYLQTLRQLVEHAEQAGDLSRALDLASRAVGADPLREETYRDLMRLYTAAGQPSAALRQYRELERMLQEELGETPSPLTRELARQLSMDVRTATEPPAAQPTLPTRHLRSAARQGMALPTGTITLLLTAIERATPNSQCAGDAMEVALASHHALLRREFQRHGGYEAQDMGDGFLVAFPRAGDALACAVQAQRALAAHPWSDEVRSLQVRMALHTGDVTIEEGDYRGLAPRHTSSLLVVGHGGQILCSETAVGLLQRGGLTALEPGVQFVDLGVYRLRDVPTPERLFQVNYPAMPQQEFPAPRAESGHSSSLPLQLSRFFGRQSEVARLRALLLFDGARLVTLTGPGGTGKTRLAVEIARQLTETMRGAVWFVSMAELVDTERIADAIRHALGLPGSPHLTPLEQVVDALSRQPALLVLDNFEHLLEGGGALVRTLLERVPRLTCLVTSRRRLGLDGEREVRVPPLPTPAPELAALRHPNEGTDVPSPRKLAAPSSAEVAARESAAARTPVRLMTYESVQLFVDRAQAVNPDFQVTPANALAVAEICQGLEGIPLAIELAAARAQVLTPAQMRSQLAHRFDFLVSRRRDAAARHRTLRATIVWGYQLLTPELQQFFARLSVFRGGWTLEAAEAVCVDLPAEPLIAGVTEGTTTLTPDPAPALPGSAAPEILDYLAELQGWSLLLAEESGGGMRFRMLETLREFAGERLTPAERAARQRRHAEHYLAVLQGPVARPATARERLSALEAEVGNFRAALAWSLTNEPALALRLAVALGNFWRSSGFYDEGREALAGALAGAREAPAALRAQALGYAVRLASEQGDLRQARKLAEQRLALCRENADLLGIADALEGLAAVLRFQGDEARGSLLEENLAIRQRLGDDRRRLLPLLVEQAGRQGDRHSMRLLIQEWLAIDRERGIREGSSWAIHRLGILAYQEGAYAEARALLQQSLEARRQFEGGIMPVYPLIHLAHVACRQGEYEEARALLDESLVLCRAAGSKRLIVECLDVMAEVAVGQEQWERAIRLYGATEAIRDATGLRWSPLDEAERAGQVASLRDTLGTARFEAVWNAGRSLTWHQSVDYALERNP